MRPVPAPKLSYDRGTLVWAGTHPPTGHFVQDPRTGECRAPARLYAEAQRALAEAGVAYDDRVMDELPVDELAADDTRLRDYQDEALDAWLVAEMRGVVAMPTGAGKTVVAIKAIEAAQAATLVVVPTLDLADQWRARLREAFGVRVGLQGGGERSLEALTVATYDSAYLHAAQWGSRFRLVVFDEVHHLPSEGYRHIAEMLAAPWRLGLSATYERPDGLHALLPDLVGPLVHEVEGARLAGTHLAPYTVERIHTDLTADERALYEAKHEVYVDFISTRKGFRGVQGHRRLIMRSGVDPDARRALLAREAARDVMMNGAAKLDELAQLLERHAGERVLVFTEHNRLVRNISLRFLVPAITHKTHPDERAQTLARFRAGDYSVVVTSKVLDEGVDVPAASVAIILSGSGSRREFVQRLGRILRPQPGKQARLYEVVSRGTTEETTSARRRGQAPAPSGGAGAASP